MLIWLITHCIKNNNFVRSISKSFYRLFCYSFSFYLQIPMVYIFCIHLFLGFCIFLTHIITILNRYLCPAMSHPWYVPSYLNLKDFNFNSLLPMSISISYIQPLLLLFFLFSHSNIKQVSCSILYTWSWQICLKDLKGIAKCSPFNIL